MPDQPRTLSDFLGDDLAALEHIAQARETWDVPALAEELVAEAWLDTPEALTEWKQTIEEAMQTIVDQHTDDQSPVAEDELSARVRLDRLGNAVAALAALTWIDLLEAQAKLAGRDYDRRAQANRPDTDSARDHALAAADMLADARILEGGE